MTTLTTISNSSILRAASYDFDTMILQVFFRKGDAAAFHGATVEDFQWLTDAECDPDEAFKDLRDRLYFLPLSQADVSAHFALR